MAGPKGYSRAQIVLHWLVALILVPQFVLHDQIKHEWYGWLKGTPVTNGPLVVAHVVGGTLILLLVLWRIGLRMDRGAPGLPADGIPALDLLARVVHRLIYLVLILLPITGMVAWFDGQTGAAALHQAMKLALLVLVALHVAGALYHQFIRRDGLMERMKRAG